jgi:hypothetical protein
MILYWKVGRGTKMSIIDNTIYTMLNGKRTITKPIFVKDFDNKQPRTLVTLVVRGSYELDEEDYNYGFMVAESEGKYKIED